MKEGGGGNVREIPYPTLVVVVISSMANSQIVTGTYYERGGGEFERDIRTLPLSYSSFRP